MNGRHRFIETIRECLEMAGFRAEVQTPLLFGTGEYVLLCALLSKIGLPFMIALRCIWEQTMRYVGSNRVFVDVYLTRDNRGFEMYLFAGNMDDYFMSLILYPDRIIVDVVEPGFPEHVTTEMVDEFANTLAERFRERGILRVCHGWLDSARTVFSMELDVATPRVRLTPRGVEVV